MAKKTQKIIDETIDDLKEDISKQVKKQIKNNIIDQTYEYKQELTNEMKNTINLEVQKAVKIEQKKLLRRKNISLFKCYIVILILLAIAGYFGYCLYKDKYFNFIKSDKTIKENQNIEEKEVEKTQEWYKENYSYLLNYANLKLDTNLLNAYVLYNDNYTIDKIDNSYLLNIAYNNLSEDKMNDRNHKISIDSNDLQEVFEKIFAREYIPEDFDYECLNFGYNKKKNNYVADNKECINQTKEIVEDITYFSEDEEHIYIETVAVVYDTKLNSIYTFNNLYNPILKDIAKESVFDNKENLDKYKYTFKKDNDSYYFESKEKIN